MKLVFFNNNNIKTSLSSIEDDVICSVPTEIMGQNLILRNIAILNTVHNIKSIEIPSELYIPNDLVHKYFPTIDLRIMNTREIFQKSVDHHSHFQNMSSRTSLITRVQESMSSIRIPFNSILHINADSELVIDEIKYPWDFLESIQRVLNFEVTSTKISSGAKISKTSIIEGPCIIEEGVVLDDFCKIKGPVYIGKNSFIGMGSLIRNSIFEHDTKIGFYCQIGESFFAGRDKVSHHNTILDTMVGQDVWFGGYSGTANDLLNKKNIEHKINDNPVNTWMDHFGSVIGNNCCIGASVIIMSGRKIPPNTQIQAGTIIKS